MNGKLSRVKLAFTYSDEKINQNVEVMANYVASGVQWYTSYRTMRYRGNVTKNKVAKGKKTPQSGSESDMSEAEKDQSNPYMNFEASETRSYTPKASAPHENKRETDTNATNGGERNSTTLVQCFCKKLYGKHERHRERISGKHERIRGRFRERFGKGRN